MKTITKILLGIAIALLYLAFAVETAWLAGLGIVLIIINIIADKEFRRVFNV